MGVPPERNCDTLKILLTNDDGFFAPGLQALRDELKQMGDVTIVAPVSEESGVGHSITVYEPLLVQEVRDGDELLGYAVQGKPADCVKLGLVELLPERPDLVVSGINAGANAGINVLYSGTVAAAIEAAFFKVTAVAVSLELAKTSQYEHAATIARRVVGQILKNKPADGELFNVNIPDLSKNDPTEIRVAYQGLDSYDEGYEARLDPRGRRYYWLKPEPLVPEHVESDLGVLAQGCISVTPLHFDLTERERLRLMASWDWSS